MGGQRASVYDVRTVLLAQTPDVPPWAGEEVVTLLVTVKAYPVIGRKTGEAVCVAGVALDEPTPRWIRLFPVHFRQLPQSRRFRKYDVVRLRVTTGRTSDRRPETRRPNLDSLVRGPHVGTGSGSRWEDRRELLGHLLGQTTTCRLYRDARKQWQGAPSLGLVRPRDVDLVVRPNPEYIPGGEPKVDVDLFGTEQEILEKTPFIATYRYKCADESTCRGHEQSLIDWESGELARKLLVNRTTEAAMAMHRAKFLDEMCGPDRDTYFYVGNQHQHPSSFLVLGLFAPKVGARRDVPLF